MPSEFVCPLTIPVIGPVLLCLSEFSVGRNPVILRDLPTLAGLSIPTPLDDALAPTAESVKALNAWQHRGYLLGR